MPTNLSREALECAIDHLCRFGDTDVFPHLCEINFLREQKVAVTDVLASLNLDQFQPAQAIEALCPKSRYGFRIAHQLNYVETVLFTAALIEIGSDLEKLKSKDPSYGPFAYRFSNNKVGGALFDQNRTFRDWLGLQDFIAKNYEFKDVIFTDIADFYQRIYLHRIEATLDVATPNKGVKRFIEKSIKSIRSRQSYGIPVGGAASRILAEAVLTDSDSALLDEGAFFTRFVDDFRIFVQEGQSAYEILSFLAEQLFLSEGLTLNGQKTFVMSKAKYIEYLKNELPESDENTKDVQLEAISHDIYFSEEGDDPEEVEALIAKLKTIDTLGLLKICFEAEDWNYGKVKAILKALRLTKSEESLSFIIEQLDYLLQFSKELVLLFDDIKKSGVEINQNYGDAIIEAAGSPAVRKVPTIQAWLLEFFVRGIFKCTHRQLTDLSSGNPIVERQVFLIRGRNGDVSFFRRNKTRFDAIGPFAKPAFILGATCLPRDEYETWIGAIKPRLQGPLDGLYCDWAKSKVGALGELLSIRVEEAAES